MRPGRVVGSFLVRRAPQKITVCSSFAGEGNIDSVDAACVVRTSPILDETLIRHAAWLAYVHCPVWDWNAHRPEC